MENEVLNLSSWLPAICACVGVYVGARFGAKNDKYLLKLLPIKRFLNENEETLFRKIEDDVKVANISLNEFVKTSQSDSYKRFGLRLQLAEKILDVETSCETMMMRLGFDNDSANLLRLKVNRKNEKLNYFDEPIGELFGTDDMNNVDDTEIMQEDKKHDV